MKKILVTGASGFIGSHLTEFLCKLGYDVRAFVHYNSSGSWGWLDSTPIKKDIEIVRGDIRDFDSVSNAVKGVDTVYHLAALIGIPYSYESPLAYVKTNIEGSYNVLESVKRHGVGRVMMTSTSEVYGTAKYTPIDELHPLQPQSPYSASKISADQIALSYFNSFNTPVVIARPFNTYGPRQSARAIIPAIAVQLLNGRKNIELGSVTPKRDVTFVKDTVAAMHTIANEDSFIGSAVNIGSGTEYSIRDFFEKLCSITGTKAEISQSEERLRPQKSEVHRLLCNNQKIISSTNWKTNYSIEQGLAETVEWLKTHLHLYKADIFNV